MLSDREETDDLRMRGQNTKYPQRRLLRRNTTMSIINIPNEDKIQEIHKDYQKVFQKRVNKLIIVLSFLNSLFQYSKEQLTQKIDISKLRRLSILPFYPDDSFLKWWKKSINIITFICFITYPLYVCKIRNDKLFMISIYVADTIFLFDIVINLLTACVDENYILHRKYGDIFYYYLKSWLLFDLLSIFPYQFVTDIQDIQFFKFFRMLKYFLYKFQPSYIDQFNREQIRETFSQDSAIEIKEGILYLCNVFMTATLLTHLFGCMDSYFTQTDYVNGIYWAIQTITSVGYGDVVMIRELSIVWMIIGFGFYVVTIGNFSHLIARSKIRVHGDYLFQLEQLTFATDLSEKFKIKFQGFIFTNLTNNAFWNQEHKIMVSGLPQQLQKYLMLSSMLEICRRVPLLLYDVNALIELLRTSRFFVVEQDEMIFRVGQNSNEIFFLLNGEVRIMTQDKCTLLNILEGTFFGEFEAFEESLRATYAVSKTKSLILLIQYKSLKIAMNQSSYLRFKISELYQRRKQLLIHNYVEQKRQKHKYKRSVLVTFTQKMISMTAEDYKQEKANQQYQDMSTYNKQLLHKILGRKKQRQELLLFKFKRCVSRVIDLNRQLNQTPPEEWKELQNYFQIRRVFPMALLEEKNSTFSRKSASVHSYKQRFCFSLLSARKSEIRLKRIMVYHNKKLRERFRPLSHIVSTLCQEEFGERRIQLQESKFSQRSQRNQRHQTLIQRVGDVDLLKINILNRNLNQIFHLWTQGSIAKFDCYKYVNNH